MFRLRDFAIPLLMCMIPPCIVTAVLMAVATQQLHQIERPEGEHPTIEQELGIFDVPPLAPGVVGSPAQDLRHEFAAKYNAARKEKLKHQAGCESCGKSSAQLATIGGHLETHHVISVERIYNENLDDGLISDTANLIVLCRGGKSSECHFRIGHDPDGPWKPMNPSWSVSNPNVRKDAAKILHNGGKF